MIARLTVVVAAAALLLAPSAAFANWCETYPGSGKFTDQNCDKPYDNNRPRTAAPTQPKPPANTSKLRDEIRAKLGKMSDTVPASPRDRWNEASRRAHEAVESTKYTTDPTEKAQLKRKYDEAMRDLRASGQEVVAATSNPQEKEALRRMMADYEVGAAQAAAEAGFTGAAPPPQVAAAPAELKKVFTVCEAPERGVTTCYEIPRTGSQCLKVYYQGGERTWADSRTNACSAADLAQRDDYYAGKAVGTGPVPDERTKQLDSFMASLPPRCQDDLRNFMLNSRDSSATKAMDSYRSISSNAECRAGMEKLATILGVELPRRRLADADRQAWTGAMTDRPRETVVVPETYRSTGDSGWNVDPDEVISTGITFLNVLGAVLGVVAGGVAVYNSYNSGGGGYYAPAPARGYGGPTGGGYVYRGSNRGSNSTITGTR